MINTQVYLNNIKSDLGGQSWTSPDGSGTTSFQVIYTAPIWVHDQGYPFLVLLDEPQGMGGTATSEDADFISNIAFHICANPTTVSTQSTKHDQEEEALLRIREAYDFLREYIIQDGVVLGWRTSPNDATRGSHANLTWRSENITVEDAYIEENNLYRRTLRLPISDVLNTN